MEPFSTSEDRVGLEGRGAAQPCAGGAGERRSEPTDRSLILVIDDDADIRAALANLLELSGYEVAVAADGQEGEDLLRLGLDPTAVVLDLMMPRMDGWTFLARLRSDPRFRDLPVVVTSAIAMDRPEGADAVLQKPFEVRELNREVARLTRH